MRRTPDTVLKLVARGLAWSVLALLAMPGARAESTTNAATLVDLPGGITLANVKVGAAEAVVFADADSRPLYTREEDPEGSASCTDECLAKWKPLPAPDGAVAAGDWSVVARDGGSRQWAFRGKPLYTYLDEAPFKVSVVGESRYLRQMQSPSGHGYRGVWSVAVVAPAQWITLPAAFDIAESVMVQGQVLVSTSGQPLYSFSGSADEERALPSTWRPRAAGLLELPVGDFAIRARPDGTRQWTYRGAALYSYAEDVVPGDLNGMDVVAGMMPTVMMRYFRPKEVLVQKDARRGGRLVEAGSGRTLYVRERHYYAPISYNLRFHGRGEPAVGREIGTAGCDQECERTWRPLLAPAEARSRGYWTALERPDGTRQWAYRGYALYTNSAEPPGTTYGTETWTFNVGDERTRVSDVQENLGIALFWRVSVP